jgi:23S rRNA (pseudouridine1915-N3)-methyltransferase
VNIYYILPESKKQSLSQASEEIFLKRLNSYVKLKVIKFKLEKNGDKKFKQTKDEERLLKLIPKNTKLVLCDERGESLNTKQLLLKIENLLKTSSSISFVIGGPYGFSEEFKTKANCKVRLSDLTMNSDLASAVLWEQLYRVFSLKAGHPYHNE